MILCGDDGFPSSENLKADDQPKPKYWNNVPKSDSNNVNPLQEMHLMRQEQKAHQVVVFLINYLSSVAPCFYSHHTIS